MSTLLCVPIMVLDEHTALADAAAARDAGADLVEFRIDEFFTGVRNAAGELEEREVRTILRLVAESSLPCIVTCRSQAESGGVGGYDGDEMARVALLERLGTAGPRDGAGGRGEHPPRYIDIELASYAASANIRQKVNLAVDHPKQQRDVRTGLILSTHDFQGRPRDLLRRLSLMQSEPAAAIVKVAYMARSIRDNLEVFDLLAEGAGGDGKPMIGLAMGRFGLMSRVLAPKFGGFLTFGSLRNAAATAPGQPTVAELLDVYRFRSITHRTRVYGLIGWPVEHSLSPLIHNAGFESIEPDSWSESPESGFVGGTNGDTHPTAFHGVYLPLPVPPEWEHFKATLGALLEHPRLDFHGCSVTVPHKQHLVRYAKEAHALGADGIEWSIDELSEACGAANTLVVERSPAGLPVRARVLNTDAPAAVGCLSDALGTVTGVRVGLIGAGGVSRAIAAGLLSAGAEVVVFNRTLANAEQMAAQLGAHYQSRTDQHGIVAAEMEQIAHSGCRALVNCTPVGMSGAAPGDKDTTATQASPVPLEQLKAWKSKSEEPVVMDTVYNPLRTAFLRMAEGLGIRTIDGLGMFVRQAGEQFTVWTGHGAATGAGTARGAATTAKGAAPLGLFEQIAREALQERR